MTRTAEFSKDTKRQALKRAKNQCEASGLRYGLKVGERCPAPLSHGVIFDHDNPEANSKDASLDNCRCICHICNKFKTGKTDIPMIAKTVRQRDKHMGIKGPKRGFAKPPAGYSHWTRRVET